MVSVFPGHKQQLHHISVMATQITCKSTFFNILLRQMTNQSFTLMALHEGNPLVIRGFSSQKVTDVESVPMSWRHHTISDWYMLMLSVLNCQQSPVYPQTLKLFFFGVLGYVFLTAFTYFQRDPWEQTSRNWIVELSVVKLPLDEYL